MLFEKQPPPDAEGTIECCEREMPFCCGIRVLGEAEGDLGLLGEALSTEAYLDQGDAGLYLYTLIQSQKEEAEQLAKAGFKELVTFKNPETDNVVTLYGKTANQPAPGRRRRAVPQGRRRHRG